MQLKIKVDNKWVEIPATTEIADDIISDNLTYSSQKIEELVASKQVDTVESPETTVELQPNKFYKFGEVTELNLSLAEIIDNTQLNEFMFEFISGETATTLTLPDTIKWVDTPSIEANKIYQCSIVNNVGLIVGVDNV